MKFPIPEVEKLSEESKHLYDVINDESDLACVLIGTSYLDYALASLLKRHFLDSAVAPKLLEPPRGILSSFSSRCDIAYCLGLISKGLYKNLEIIGQIRNTFAHQYLSLKFDNPEIGIFIQKLTFPRLAQSVYVGYDDVEQRRQEPFKQFTAPRNKFSLTVVLMVNHLLMAGLAAQHRSKHEDFW